MRKFTEEHKRKISEALKGKKHSAEHVLNHIKATKGRKAKPFTEEHKRKISESLKGKKFDKNYRKGISPEHREKIIANNKKRIGKPNPHSFERRIKLSLSNKKRIENGTHNFWKGGKTSENRIIRSSLEYKLWREAVFKRDKYMCVWGGKEHGNRLQADHIKPFSLYPELRFAIDNGRTLCEECHKTTDTYLHKIHKHNK